MIISSRQLGSTSIMERTDQDRRFEIMRTLTDEEIDQYHHDGYVVIPHTVGIEELQLIDDEIERLIHTPIKSSAPEGWVYKLHQRESEVCRELARDDRVLALISPLVHPGIALHSSKLVAKVPHSDEVCHWHQDEGYYFDGSELDMRSEVRMSIWIPLQDATLENGCLWVVPGSHRDGVEEFRESGDGHCRRRLIRSEEAEARGVPLPVAAGDAVLFSSFLWHHSKGNITDKVRRAFIVSYQEATLPRDAYGDTAPVLVGAS